MGTVTNIRVLKEFKQKTSEIGSEARVCLFRRLPPFLGIIPRLIFNQDALKRGTVIDDPGENDGKYKILFKNNGIPYSREYPVDAVRILSKTRK